MVKPQSLNSWVSSLHRARKQISLALGVVVVFLLAQVIWWMVFQHQYIERTIAQTDEQWQQEAKNAELALQNVRLESKTALSEIFKQSPHLDLSQRPVKVNQAALDTYRQRQERYLRMFAFEVPFFLVVMLIGLFVIWRSFKGNFELRRRQENFLMAATHEFRTPISSLRLLVQTAQYRELTRDKQLEFLERMNREVERLQDVSERVLATAQLEQGVSIENLSVQNLSQVLAQQVQKQRRGLEKRGAKLFFELTQSQVPVRLDPAAFEIVLSNLLDNAVKYSLDPEKPIFVRLETKGAFALLSVEDRGIGIEKTEIPHIFDQFYRVGHELTRVAKGLGLGLYLVRGIVTLLHGTVRCEVLPLGTRFVVSLPLVKQPENVTSLARV